MTNQINGKTILYGIIGYPVSHSLSPVMHNAAFRHLGENRIYVPFTVKNVGAALTGLKGLGIRGVSVTIPHKETVIEHLDEIDPIAEKIGAVNTIVVSSSGDNKNLFGTNTDWMGANSALAEHIPLAGSKAVILGAGGSARAIGFGLLEAGAKVQICSRTEKRGMELATVLGCQWIPLDDSQKCKGDILINATSVGMTPNEDASPLDKGLLGNFAVVMDIVYAPLQTQLLRDAEEAGCTCINGLEMLLYQGVAQFELWTGLSAPAEIMREALFEATGNV